MRRTTIALTAAALAALPAPAGAESSVTIAGVERAGDDVHAIGTATFVDQPYLTLGTDPAQDPPGTDQVGADVVGVSMSTTLDGVVRMKLATAPSLAYGGFVRPMAYGWTFCVGVDGACYELNTQRFTLGSHNPLPTYADSVLYRCATSACEPGGQTVVATGWIPTYFDTNGGGFWTTLPESVGASAGTVITGIAVDPNGPVFSAAGTANPSAVQHGTGDGVTTVAPYTVPQREVAVAVASADEDPASLSYAATVAPASDGTWSATLDVAGAGEAAALYVRACYGPNNCAYATQALPA